MICAASGSRAVAVDKYASFRGKVMTTTAKHSFPKLLGATRPEDLFGNLTGSPTEMLSEVHRTYRRIARIVAPSPNGQSAQTSEELSLLWDLYRAAVAAISAGNYGLTGPKIVQTQTHTYTIGAEIEQHGSAQRHLCIVDDDLPAEFVYTFAKAENDFLLNEAQVLNMLCIDEPAAIPYTAMLPKLIENFRWADTSGPLRRVNVFEAPAGYVTLQQLQRSQSGGVRIEEMVAIWRALLGVLGYTHSRRVIHGAVLPCNVLVGSGEAGKLKLMLVNWQHAIDISTPSSASALRMAPTYEHWYPAQVHHNEPATPATDISMAARCMIALVGGSPITGELGDGLPAGLAQILKSCIDVSDARCPQNAWKLRADIVRVVESLRQSVARAPQRAPGSSARAQ